SGVLAARTVPGAVLDHTAAVAQALSLATDGTATLAGDAGRVAVHPRSLCVHGDSPDAVAVARTIRAELDNAGVEMGAFT
ncbi:MAG: LamB/YcsF family protein, partial [Mycobacterium sp.]